MTQLKYYPKAQIRQGADRRDSARPMISPQTSYRFDNCQCAGRTKDSDEQQVALRRRKTTTKRSQRGERGQLSHPWVHPECFQLALDVAPLGVVIANCEQPGHPKKKEIKD